VKKDSSVLPVVMKVSKHTVFMKIMEYLILVIIFGLAFTLGTMADSEAIRNKILSISDTNTYTITEEVKDTLRERYDNDSLEFAYCMEQEDGVINNLVEVEYTSRNETQLEHRGCCLSGVMIHSHPGGSCHLSPQDYYTFGKCQLQASAIICDGKQIAFFDKSELDKTTNLRIVTG